MAIPALSEKLPKWHFLAHVYNSNIFWAKLFLLSALKVPPSDFIQNMYQAPSKCLKRQI
jgi:hypothetical protein